MSITWKLSLQITSFCSKVSPLLLLASFKKVVFTSREDGSRYNTFQICFGRGWQGKKVSLLETLWFSWNKQLLMDHGKSNKDFPGQERTCTCSTGWRQGIRSSPYPSSSCFKKQCKAHDPVLSHMDLDSEERRQIRYGSFFCLIELFYHNNYGASI